MVNFFDNKKIVIIYFIYLIFIYLFFLHYHLDQFPLKYVYTDWLINYEGGFVRRGLLGQIIYKLSTLTDINFKYILLTFQIFGYLLYIGLILNFLLKIKINFFWILLIFSTISFLYPLSELEALGRKDIYVILLFSVFSLLNYKTINKCIFTFLIIFTISSLIHEITFFYLPYYLILLFFITKFKIKENLNFIHYFSIFIILGFLIYSNLIIGGKVEITEIIKSYKIINIDVGLSMGAFGWLGKPFLDHFTIIMDKISLTTILRYGYILFINLSVFLYFIKFEKNFNFSFIEITSKKIFLGLIVITLPTYLIALDWGRMSYLNFNFMMMLTIYFKKEDLIDEKFLEYKINQITYRLKILIFIFICFLFSPKILIDDDLSSFPLYRTMSKISNLINF